MPPNWGQRYAMMDAMVNPIDMCSAEVLALQLSKDPPIDSSP